ncbi:hypothetical protein PDESU_02789 [Pontiella desulfatans]|uniref:Uncharacterized protein n=1 Tax=Pontiella desulfatans TaxID=2750659 RepID=A0A6C2U2M4_PONDE|nr:hypothetical protein PDESU_02789 [Pontiella desulfatans]
MKHEVRLVRSAGSEAATNESEHPKHSLLFMNSLLENLCY